MSEINRPDQSAPPTPDAGSDARPTPAETRREAVRRLGKYAAYTAPALIVFLAGTTTASAS